MPSSLLFPLDQLSPSQILSQYSEWIYFTLILVFFISISGLTLRKHFDKPYVKPLIISVGLMLTVGVFMYKETLTAVFEGWGILGTILLVIMLAIIPYGLCRGLGLSASKAFFLSYILIYILSWVKFPEFYEGLSENNLGLVNLGLLILFIFSIYKVVRFGKSSLSTPTKLGDRGALRPEIDREINLQGEEAEVIEGQAEKLTKTEFRTVEDIAEALAEIQRIIEKHQNNLPREERERATSILGRISRGEDVFKQCIENLQKLFKRIDIMDLKQLEELKKRMATVRGKEKKLLKEEIKAEEEKLQMEKTIFDFESKLGRYLNSFNEFVMAAANCILNSPYPYDAKGHLANARVVLKDILEMLKETKALEEKIIDLTKTERRLLNKEREAA